MQLANEQLLSISRVAERLRGKFDESSGFETLLVEMANDKNVPRELKEIEEDRYPEFGGLAK
ncbi:MAG: hypothetical protein ABJA66_12735 [Actinomycetota bacterium]